MPQNLLEGEDVSTVDQVASCKSMATEVGMKSFNSRFVCYSSEYHSQTIIGQGFAFQGQQEILDSQIKRFRSEVKKVA